MRLGAARSCNRPASGPCRCTWRTSPCAPCDGGCPSCHCARTHTERRDPARVRVAHAQQQQQRATQRQPRSLTQRRPSSQPSFHLCEPLSLARVLRARRAFGAALAFGARARRTNAVCARFSAARPLVRGATNKPSKQCLDVEKQHQAPKPRPPAEPRRPPPRATRAGRWPVASRAALAAFD